MEKKIKEKLLENLFKNEFNKESFLEFITQILNIPININKTFNNIETNFKDYIKSWQKISEIEGKNKDKFAILIVEISNEYNPTKARIKQREFVANILKLSRLKAGLVVFYNKSYKFWRISFIKLEYEFVNGKVNEKLTPAKRSSYIVGKDEANITVIKQFRTIFDKDRVIEIEDFEEIFSLEKVTDDFFEEYKNKYLVLKKILLEDKSFMEQAKKQDLENPESFADGFVKKLMGQIIFLYFLQKKGWLGVKVFPEKLNYEEFNYILKNKLSDNENALFQAMYERVDKNNYILNNHIYESENKDKFERLVSIFNRTEFIGKWGTGDKKFIKNMFLTYKKTKVNELFFDDYLEKLFYKNLSKDRGELQYSEDFKCRIPFLNGGLFDPYGNYDWDKTSFNLDDELFYNGKDGILDIFDRYNFTINENDSYETEVAVDPEMLGKVFEALLDDRKEKGAFYTPREIVKYISIQTLINYLLTSLKEEEITKEDLEYLFNVGEFSKEHDQSDYELTNNEENFTMPKAVINNSSQIDNLLESVRIADPACGSGAFPLGILNEIIKVRNILTFYIHVILGRKEGSYWQQTQIYPRNLYTLKLDTIKNCLYGVDIEPSAVDITKLRLWLSILVDSENENVKPLPNLDCNFMIGNSLIDEFKGYKLFDEKLLKSIGKKHTKKITAMKIGFSFEDTLNNYFNMQKEFFNPYVKNKLLIKEQLLDLEFSLIERYLKETHNEDILKELSKIKTKRIKPYFIWKLFYGKVFIEKGGFDIILGNPPYIDSEEMTKKLAEEREICKKLYSCTKGNWDIFIPFIELGYNLLKENGIISYIVPNKLIGAKYSKDIKEYMMNYRISLLRDYSEVEVFKSADVYPIIFIGQKSKKSKNCDDVITEIMKDINNPQSRFEVKNNLFYQDIYWDKFFSKDSKEVTLILKLLKNNKLSDYVFIKGASTVNEAYEIKKYLYSDNIKEDKNIRFINTGTIDKYSILWGIYDTQYIKDKYKYPIISEEKLKNISEERFKESKMEKIIVAGMTKEIEAVYDNGKYLAGKSTQLLLKKDNDIDLRYILSLVNSKLLTFFFKKLFNSLSMSGGFFTIGKEQLSNLPIRKDKNQDKYIQIVERIMELKKLGKDTQELENQIDEMAYDLYELTEEEKELVRNF